MRMAKSTFKIHQLSSFLPPNSTLFFNNTRVIPARLFFQKDTGATIELFLLNPVSGPSTLVQTGHGIKAIQSLGLHDWKPETLARQEPHLTKSIQQSVLSVPRLIDREAGIVEFNWTPAELTFAEIISQSGPHPLASLPEKTGRRK